ncbi:MAG: helix-turn-helix transcriptional regulator, partial [Saprospiraceae bacterium]|nr:helix-turn-helix transcriptional regulator [Saprospiraceae bacterium]
IRELVGGVSQVKLSEILVINKEQIKSIENGRAKISVEIALALENTFHLDFRWILTGAGHPRHGGQAKDAQELLSDVDASAAIAAKGKDVREVNSGDETGLRDLLKMTERRLDALEKLMRAALVERIRQEDSPDQKDELLKMRVISSFIKDDHRGASGAPTTPD